MTNPSQFFLISSPNVPANLWLLSQDDNEVAKEFDGKIKEEFAQVLTPVGVDLANAAISVPEGTNFAGVLWGDGEHFDMYQERTWGLLGEIERISSTHCLVRGAAGDVIAEYLDIEHDCGGIPHVMPPEAFGLFRKPWWEDVFAWCND